MKRVNVFPEHKPGRYHVTVAADGLQTWKRLRERGERVNDRYVTVARAWKNARLRHDVDGVKSRLAANVALLDLEAIKWLIENDPCYAGGNAATLDRRLREPPMIGYRPSGTTGPMSLRDLEWLIIEVEDWGCTKHLNIPEEGMHCLCPECAPDDLPYTIRPTDYGIPVPDDSDEPPPF
jgi:hypothetical protein